MNGYSYRIFIVDKPNPDYRVGQYFIVHDDLDGAVKARLTQAGKHAYKVVADSSIEIPFSSIRPFVREVEIGGLNTAH